MRAARLPDRSSRAAGMRQRCASPGADPARGGLPLAVRLPGPSRPGAVDMAAYDPVVGACRRAYGAGRPHRGGLRVHQQIRTSPGRTGENIRRVLDVLAAAGVNIEGIGPDFESPHVRTAVPDDRSSRPRGQRSRQPASSPSSAPRSRSPCRTSPASWRRESSGSPGAATPRRACSSSPAATVTRRWSPSASAGRSRTVGRRPSSSSAAGRSPTAGRGATWSRAPSARGPARRSTVPARPGRLTGCVSTGRTAHRGDRLRRSPGSRRPGSCARARGDVHVATGPPGRRAGRLAVVHPDPDRRREPGRAAVVGEGALDGDGAVDGGCGRRERHEEAVAGMIDLHPSVGVEEAAEHGVVPGAQLRPGGVADGLDERARRDDGGEHEGPGREPGSRGPPTPRGRPGRRPGRGAGRWPPRRSGSGRQAWRGCA